MNKCELCKDNAHESHYILHRLQAEPYFEKQIKPILEAADYCDIDGTFMGFMDVYKALSEIIPKHWTIVDFGCSYAPQCYYFRNHKGYIGVDSSTPKRFEAKNTSHLYGTIQDFINTDVDSPIFAICSYVPHFHAAELVRKNFKNCFVYYPEGGIAADHFVKALLKKK